MRPIITAGALALCAVSCQTYPFEPRNTRRSEVKRINEVVLTTRPTDILLVVDNSGTMEGKRGQLVSNISAFVDVLIDSATDFHLGIVTTDVDCNLPNQSCVAGQAGAASKNCCTLHNAYPGSWCTEARDLATGKLHSNCDGGRLRADSSGRRIFTRPVEGRKPTDAERQAWTANLTSVISGLACDRTSTPALAPGSAYQSGLEAALRVVGCSQGQCPETTPQPDAVAELDAGFVRTDADPAKNADLVLIFLTGTDDCSFRDATYYQSPTNNGDLNQQAVHLCDYTECYASYGAKLDGDGDGTPDWSDIHSPNHYYFCDGSPRQVSPPPPTDVGDYLDRLVALKGGDVKKVRGAAIISGLPDANFGTGFQPGACYESGGHPSLACSCLFSSAKVETKIDLFCQLTTLLGTQYTNPPGSLSTPPFPQPPAGTKYSLCHMEVENPGGCQALPGTRYTAFLKELAARHVSAKVAEDVLIDSLCQEKYTTTLSNIVNNIILRNCFDMGVVPAKLEDLQVSYNGGLLANVPKGTKGTPGWSWVPGASEICLEGLVKKPEDRFEIFVASPP